MNPEMPAEETAKRQPRYGQRRPMHPALIRAGHLEGGEVLAHFSQVIDLRVWIARPVGVVVNEVSQLQIVPHPHAVGVFDMSPIDGLGIEFEAIERKKPEAA